jgi:hypothetical protein
MSGSSQAAMPVNIISTPMHINRNAVSRVTILLASEPIADATIVAWR